MGFQNDKARLARENRLEESRERESVAVLHGSSVIGQHLRTFRFRVRGYQDS